MPGCLVTWIAVGNHQVQVPGDRFQRHHDLSITAELDDHGGVATHAADFAGEVRWVQIVRARAGADSRAARFVAADPHEDSRSIATWPQRDDLVRHAARTRDELAHVGVDGQTVRRFPGRERHLVYYNGHMVALQGG